MTDLSLSGYRVLVIEDDVHLAYLLQLAFAGAGADCRWACDAASGLAEFKNSRPHLVLLAMDGTEMCGYDVCRMLREITHVPVVLICPTDARDVQIQGFKCGADDCIIKPINPSLLISRVMAHLRRAYRYNSPLKTSSKEPVSGLRAGASYVQRRVPVAAAAGD